MNKKNVYIMVGDGSWLMLHTEILTSIQLGLTIANALGNFASGL